MERSLEKPFKAKRKAFLFPKEKNNLKNIDSLFYNLVGRKREDSLDEQKRGSVLQRQVLQVWMIDL